MSKEKLRGIIGSVVVILFSTLALAFLALPMYQQIAKVTFLGTTDTTITPSATIFEWLGHLNVEGIDEKMRASLVMFLLVAIVASVLVVLAIVHLVGVLLGNKKLNMTLLMQALSVALVVLSLLGLILCCAALPKAVGEGDNVIRFTAQAGSVLPLVMSILTVVGAFILPWHKVKKTSKK